MTDFEAHPVGTGAALSAAEARAERAEAALDRITAEAVSEAQRDKAGLQNQIGEMLKIIDGWDEERAAETGGFTMHVRGNTPDWYVLAAFWSCYGFGLDDPRALKGSA